MQKETSEADGWDRHCQLCHSDIDTGLLCSHCHPDTCLHCSSSHVTISDFHEVTCSHGCTYPLHDFINKTIYTAVLNDSPVDVLTYAGPRVEIIIPSGTPITVHENRPSQEDIPSDHITGTHFTRFADKLLENGVQYPPHKHASGTPDYLQGTIRENAAYAWPTEPDYILHELGDEWSDHVYFTMPEESVTVSSYQFLDLVVATTGDPDTIPPKYYNESLTFTVQQLRDACEKHDRPIDPDALLV